MSGWRSIYQLIVPARLRDAIRFVLVPRYRNAILQSRARRIRRAKQEQAEAALHPVLGTHVLAGPFVGMRHASDAYGSVWVPKILGTYELELHDVIEEVIATGYSDVFDIGAAEGYYACGMGARMPDTNIVCFEMSEQARVLLADSARRNEIADHVEILGECTASELTARRSHGRAFVLCDVEGAEVDLLDPQKVEWLREADILVELHDFVDATISIQLRRRFEDTHEIVTIDSSVRTSRDIPSEIAGQFDIDPCALDELRPCPMQWFWMKRRAT